VRELFDGDREALLDAMRQLWDVPTHDGRKAWGPRYNSIADLTGYHIVLASDRHCDHMHDGLGFLTQVRGFGRSQALSDPRRRPQSSHSQSDSSSQSSGTHRRSRRALKRNADGPTVRKETPTVRRFRASQDSREVLRPSRRTSLLLRLA
jgi:hypothetical protein